MSKDAGGGGGDEGVWQAARAGLVLVGMGLVLFFLPVLITSFLIGLFWYQAYIDGDYRSYRRTIWPVVLTLIGFIYLIGLPGKLSSQAPGVLFSDFFDTTNELVANLMDFVASLLPKKMALKLLKQRISVSGFRKYLWWIPFLSAAVFAALRYKSPEMKPVLYDFVCYLATPFRKASRNPIFYFVFVILLKILAAAFQFPN